MELLHVCAPNTVSGNARRVWLLIKDGAITDGEIEDCGGKPKRFRDYLALRVSVSAAEWKNWTQQLQAVKAWQAKVASVSGVPLTGGPCHCRPGLQRDNCPDCEGTGRAIDWRAHHAARRALA